MNASAAMKQYKTVGVHSGVMDASPHRLVQMMMEGVLEKIALAKGNVNRNEIASKGVNITKAINIVAGLRASLNIELGGEIAVNLDRLYDYMIRQLMKANVKNDESVLDEVSGLMIDIKSSWDAIDGQVVGQLKVGDIRIESLVVISRTMLEKAKVDCWDEVMTLEKERQLLLSLYFADEVELTDDVAAIQVGIEEIRDLDEQLIVLGQQKKKYLTQVLQDFGKGKKAIKAYSKK